MKVWIDFTASAHLLVFRPLVELLREAGDEVEITARDYAQTLQLIELHGMTGRRDRAPRAAARRSARRALRCARPARAWPLGQGR